MPSTTSSFDPSTWNRASRKPPASPRTRGFCTALLLIPFLLTTAGIGTSHAAVRYVRASAPGPAHDGTSWARAYTNLQTALAAAVVGDEIWVGAGVYKPTATTNRAASFVLVEGVAIYGGFPADGGNGTFAARDPNLLANRTILSGDIDHNDTNTDGNHVVEFIAQIQGSNSFHIVTSASPVSSNTIVDGFLLTAGNANGSGTDSGGGALRNVNGSAPRLRNLRFEGNAGDSGAAIYNAGSSPTLEDILFVNNRTSGTNGGGGMRNLAGANPILNRVTFISNIAFRGGGMHNSGNCRPILTDVDFIANSGNNMGGGLYNENSSPQLNQVEFWGNVANFGSGVANNSTSAPVFVNGLFRDNRAFQRGAIYNSSSNARFVNCTFSQNNAGEGGGAMENFLSAPVLQNCILWGNTKGGTVPSQIEGSVLGAQSARNLIEGGYSLLPAAVVSTANPLFADPVTDDFRLQNGSPAIAMGDNAALPTGITTDLDGKPRLVPFGTDLGAYESQQLAFRDVPDSVSIPRLPTGGSTRVTNWFPSGTGLSVVFNLLASSGDVRFLIPPAVGPDGALTFRLAPGTSGRAVFEVWLVDPSGVFGASRPIPFSIVVSKLAGGIYPQVSFDHTASQAGPQSGATAKATARIRGYRHPAGQRKGVAILPVGFGASLAVFPDPAEEVIDPITGDPPRSGSALGGASQLVWSEGFDVYEVWWHDPRTHIQANAMVLVDMLSQMAGGGFPVGTGPAESIGSGEKVVLIGGSMGGLVSRFALCYLDTLQVPYHCDLFLSVDSPQEGAYIPIGLQYFAKYLERTLAAFAPKTDIKLLNAVLDTIEQPATKQMLLVHHSRATNAVLRHSAEEFDAFFGLLKNTYGDWPTKASLRMAAIASGRGDGFFQESGVGGVGSFMLPKPGGDFRILRWTSDRAPRYTNASSYRLPFPFDAIVIAFDITLTGWLEVTANAVTRSSSPQVVFSGGPSAVLTVNNETIEINFNDSDATLRNKFRTLFRDVAEAEVGAVALVPDAVFFPIVDPIIGLILPEITALRTYSETRRVQESDIWDWLPGGLRDTAKGLRAALDNAGTISKLSEFHCFIPTVSALAVSGFVAPEEVAIPNNAADLSPFDAVYHFGTHGNTLHLEDFGTPTGWLSQVIGHELRILLGEFKLEIDAPLLPVTWRGTYELQTSADPAGPWANLFRAEDGVHIPALPLPDRAFFRLGFPHMYR